MLQGDNEHLNFETDMDTYHFHWPNYFFWTSWAIGMTMFFVDDIVLIVKTRNQSNKNLNLWRRTLETNSLKISRVG